MTVLTEPGVIELPKSKPCDYQVLGTTDVIISNEKITKICFVCTGNTCRSPMAMALYNHLFNSKKSFAVSLGLYAHPGDPISEYAVAALTERGIPSSAANRYERHRAFNASLEMLSDCDRIIGMTDSHTLELLGRFPKLARKISGMPRNISDPYGGDLECYKKCLAEIEAGIKELFILEN